MGCKRAITCSRQHEAGGRVNEDERVHGAQRDLHAPRLLPPVRAAARLQRPLQGHVLLQQVHLLHSTRSGVSDTWELTHWVIINP